MGQILSFRRSQEEKLENYHALKPGCNNRNKHGRYSKNDTRPQSLVRRNQPSHIKRLNWLKNRYTPSTPPIFLLAKTRKRKRLLTVWRWQTITPPCLLFVTIIKSVIACHFKPIRMLRSWTNEENSKFNGFCAGSLFLAPLFSPARFALRLPPPRYSRE